MAPETGIFFRPFSSPEEADITLIGVPFDGTVSGRPGTRYGPAAAREATLEVEDYSPYLDRDIADLLIADEGDLEIPPGDTVRTLQITREACSELIGRGARVCALGGEHLVSLPLVEAHAERYGSDLFVIHFDAHADLRTDYLGVELSHATVMRRIVQIVGRENVCSIGIRSGTRDEWDMLRGYEGYFGGACGRPLGEFASFVRDRLSNRKVYLTLDLDVFDPGIMPGTGTPEPGGISFPDFTRIIGALTDIEIVGADIVELSPHYDQSGISSALAATVLREILLLMGPRK